MTIKDIVPHSGNGQGDYQNLPVSPEESQLPYPSLLHKYHELEDPAMMLTDVVGRVNNTNLSKTKALLPLFEAIINSFHAIEKSTENGKGRIEIYIHRDKSQRHLSEDDDQFKVSNPITGFSIIDNGIGFNSTNYESFKTADTRLKETQGGKGIGRFLWLKAFNLVQVSSIFKEKGNFYKRSFDFVLQGIPLQNRQIDTTEEAKHKTEVKLDKIKKKYQDVLQRKYTTIADRIIEHCLIYFLSEKCPEIIILDEDEDIALNVNARFTEKVKPYSTSETFTLKKQEFNIQYLKLYFGDATNHRIHFCADQREVLNKQLYKYLPDLKSQRLTEEEEQEFAFVAYVSGDYLDKTVNAERTDFNLADDSDPTPDAFDISKQELLDEIVGRISNHLGENLNRIEKEKFEQFHKFVKEESPRYRPLLKYGEEELKSIPAGLPNEKLDIEMHKALANYETKLKEEGQRFIGKDVELPEDDPKFEEEYGEYINKVTETGKSRLAEYILQRRVILNLLEKSLQRQENGKFSKEEKIHQILYPMRTTSDETNFENQNLWIVDEKLAYHYYLASDMKFSQMEPLDMDSEQRPDILIFDHPSAFVEGEYPFYSMVILELKKPEKKDYSEEKNPIQQIYDYIDLLRESKVEDKNGGVIRLDKSARFYCYILVNLTPKIEKFAKSYKLSPTPDNNGYYGYNDSYNAYVEIIDYKKLLEDSKKRNRVLFDKLGLPH